MIWRDITWVYHHSILYLKGGTEQGVTESKVMAAKTAPIFSAAPYLARFPSKRFWVDYDEDADVLYIIFERPQKATDSNMRDEGVLLRYRGKQLAGVTILDVSTRSAG
jgi:uncharacterized protein YuzE